MQARRDKGLCYNCDERFVPGHKSKTQQVFILETMIELEIDEDTIEALKEAKPLPIPEISLHALLGVTTLQAMCVNGVICGKLVHILINSGSTHNFVNSKFARKLDCCKVPSPTFRVMVANEECLQCDEIYLIVPMEIQGYDFQTNVYPLDLQGSSIVLGMQWLRKGVAWLGVDTPFCNLHLTLQGG